ncbi:MAG: hypothetical protein DRP64_11195 [Verrucomicrobia bacterium]|nr:MAG: hypothetical protein DRP64_11195 [Verrucomicrobiota bacterium]
MENIAIKANVFFGKGLVKVLLFVCSMVLASTVHAQWLTQSIELKAGWNAVFLHVDPSHLLLDDSIGGDSANPITQVWRWNPPSTVQFYDSPGDATFNVSGWAQWKRLDPDSPLKRLVGNTAYLVECANDYTWAVRGFPVLPRADWNMEGLNLIGFPAALSNPPEFSSFLAEASDLQSLNVELYRYQGETLSEDNPKKIPPSLYRYVDVQRGQAYWMRAGETFNNYFGPFEVVVSGADGINFHDNLSSASLRLRNLTGGELTVSVELMASETPPVGQPAISGVPPLLVRGPRNLNGLKHGYSELPEGSSRSWTLAARGEEGSEVEVVLGLDRSAMTQEEGSLLAGILQITDSLGHIEVYVPVSGSVASGAGLWVGEALVTQVGQYLKTYEDGAAAPIITTNGSTVVTNDLVISASGEYVVSDINMDLADVPKWFPLRLIVHSPPDESAILLQRVFYGTGSDSNQIVSRTEAALDPARLADARRISATHLPWAEENPGWVFDGPLEQGALITATVDLPFNDHRSNPFLHTYHPDHDNLDARFETELAQGAESYSVVREIGILVDAPGTNFTDRISGGQTLIGDYRETFRMIGLPRAGGTNDTRTFEVRGVFRLDRISDIPVLTDPL